MRDNLNRGKAIVLGICIAVMLSACGEEETPVDASRLYGTWVRESGDLVVTYILNVDKTFEEIARSTGDYPVTIKDSGTYTYDGQNIVIISDEFETTSEYQVTFETDVMIWDNGMARLEYKKK